MVSGSNLGELRKFRYEDSPGYGSLFPTHRPGYDRLSSETTSQITFGSGRKPSLEEVMTKKNPVISTGAGCTSKEVKTVPLSEDAASLSLDLGSYKKPVSKPRINPDRPKNCISIFGDE